MFCAASTSLPNLPTSCPCVLAALPASCPAGSNVTSVAEDEVMRMLVLFRNFIPAHEQIKT